MRTMLRSKIHRLTVTDCNLGYEGSITIGNELLKSADILPYEQVTVLNINTGSRFITYAMEGEEGVVCLNGAAARLGNPGDKLIVLTYHLVDEEYALPVIINLD